MADPTNATNPPDGARRPVFSQEALSIAFVVETFARDMGYVNNTLPKFLARRGHTVNVVTTDLMPYHQLGDAESLFGREFVARNENRVGREAVDGYTVHTLPSRPTLGYPRIDGLKDTLDGLRPDVICTFTCAGWLGLDAARAASSLGCALILGSHTGKTSFPLASEPHPLRTLVGLRNFALRKLPGAIMSARAHACVVPTRDCGEVAVRFCGVPSHKIRVMYLPVDTDFFHPPLTRDDDEQRVQLRAELGFDDGDVVCVYSGKLTTDKNARVLGEATAILRAQGHRIRALFIGAGAQHDEIARLPGVVVVPFMPVSRLGAYYRAADIGVWMNESISFLDAAVSGLPLVLSDTVKDASHIHEFTTVYRSNDASSLAEALVPMLDEPRRTARGTLAARLGRERFAATKYAEQREALFREAIFSRGMR